MRNKEMTLLKALGIIFVVIGHKYDTFKWFPIYSFHMALFFFASGYFYKETYEENVLAYIIKRIRKVIPLYFGFNLFYMIVTYVLYKKYDFFLGTPPFSLKNFFITPFINGHQFFLFLAAWFILALLIVQIVFIILYKYLKNIIKNIHIHLIAFFLIGILGTYVAKCFAPPNDSILMILIRTCFGLFFYYLGFYYKQNENKEIFSSLKIISVIILQVILVINFNVAYSLVFGNFNGYILIPLVTSINGIYLYLFISKALSTILEDNDILYTIGNHTASVMINHLFVFFLINYTMLKFNNVNRSQLNNIWFAYQPDRYWLVYVVLGVIVPVYLAELYGILRKRILKKLP